jgi:hypothetical protein
VIGQEHRKIRLLSMHYEGLPIKKKENE